GVDFNPNGTYKATIGNDTASKAGYFTDGISTVDIVNGTYAIETTSDVKLGTIHDSSDVDSISPSNRILYYNSPGGAISQIDWSGTPDQTSAAISFDSSGHIYFSPRYLYFPQNAIIASGGGGTTNSIDPYSRYLYASNGTTVAADWSADGVDFNPNGTYKATIGDDTTGYKAGYFTDGTRTVDIADGTYAIETTDGTGNAYLSESGSAGYFTHTSSNVRLANFGGSTALTTYDGTRTVSLSDYGQNIAGNFQDGTYTAYIVDSGNSRAGYFSDGANSATLADATNAITAVGNIDATGYSSSTTAGITDCYDSTAGGQVCSTTGLVTSITDDPSDAKFKLNPTNYFFDLN
ncbi:MAG: hypothetical protein H7836_17705, partial [Magnetococcus sp. YQC-3]